MEKTYYLTTPIYYPSGKFHIGTAYTTVLADAIKRYKKLRGYETYLLTGRILDLWVRMQVIYWFWRRWS